MAVLPFRKDGGEVRNREDTVLATVSYDVWRQATLVGAGGEVDLWEGICEPAAAEHLIGRGNRTFVAEGVKFRVEDAIEHDVLGYVELTLRDPRAQG